MPDRIRKNPDSPDGTSIVNFTNAPSPKNIRKKLQTLIECGDWDITNLIFMIKRCEKANTSIKVYGVIFQFMIQQFPIYHKGCWTLIDNIINRIDYRENQKLRRPSIVFLMLQKLKTIAIHFFKTADSEFSVRITADLIRWKNHNIISQSYLDEIKLSIQVVNKYKNII